MGAGWKHGPARGGPASGAGRGGPARGGAARSHSEDKNGPGWGGSARGAGGPRLREAGDPESDAIRALSRDPKNIEAKAPLRELAMSVWVEVCKDENHPHRVIAAEKLIDRIDGKPTQPVDATVTRATIKSEPMTEDEWVATHGMGAAAGTSESTH